MLFKANNIYFSIDISNESIKRVEFTEGSMLFSDVDSGDVPSSEDSAVFYPESENLKIFRAELSRYLSGYKMALNKFRKLKAFI